MRFSFFCSVILVFLLNLRAAEPVSIDWTNGKQVQTGVLHIAFEVKTPRLMKVNILRIDLQTPGMDFIATARDPDWGKSMPDAPDYTIRTKRRKTRSFLKDARKNGWNMIVAVNAAPWGPWRKPFNHKYADPSAVNISNGELISENPVRMPAFIIYNDGTPAIVPEVNKNDYTKIKIAASGFSIVARNGKIVFQDDTLAPRTVYGISADRRYLFLMTVDGRQTEWSVGATTVEAGIWLLSAGASDVINMDGGGSTSMFYWDQKNDVPVALFHHANGYERSVASNIGIVLK